MGRNKRVVIAMSGGVDSSVAAALLRGQGYEVIGLTMCFNLKDTEGKPSCGGAQGISDAKRVADALGIEHHVLGFGDSMRDKVIEDFVREYSAGRTPNPCVRCNEFLKFDELLVKALGLDAQYLATGHYARVIRSSDVRGMSASQKRKFHDGGGKLFLAKAKDLKKDQSYFLYRLTQDKLKHIMFPLGGYTKQEVRQMAHEFRLPVAQKAESQEICFVPGSYQDFLKDRLAGRFSPGPIVDTRGKFLGMHRGIPFYTIGQRDKLGIACGHPVYIVELDPVDNVIVVGTKDEAMSRGCRVSQVVWPSGKISGRKLLSVRIRHLSPESSAWVKPVRGGVEISFKEPRFAVTPGQSAVFYDKDIVVGGGIIDEVFVLP